MLKEAEGDLSFERRVRVLSEEVWGSRRNSLAMIRYPPGSVPFLENERGQTSRLKRGPSQGAPDTINVNFSTVKSVPE